MNKIFISYSHDSEEHKQKVLALGNRLNKEGLDCVLDQYVESPEQGWPKWMDRQIEQADFVLIICTQTYFKRARDEVKPKTGKGVKWESMLTYQDIYDNDSKNKKFIPVIFTPAGESFILKPLRGFTYYRLDSEDGYKKLYRRLTGQPETQKPPQGKVKPMPPKEPESLSFSSEKESPREKEVHTEATQAPRKEKPQPAEPPAAPEEPPEKPRHTSTSPLTYAFISLGACLVGVGLLLLFIFKAKDLVALGIGDYVYYVLLIPMALAAAVFLFGVLRSYASYKGKVFSGYLEIGGPAVIFFLVLILGFGLLPKKTAEPFDFTVRLRDEAGKAVLRGEGKLSMLRGTKTDSEVINEKGEVIFAGIPSEYKNKPVKIELDAEGWQFVLKDRKDKEKNSAEFPMTGKNKKLTIERDDSLSTLRFSVTGEDQLAIQGAVVLVEGQEVGKTDRYGMLKATLEEEQRKTKVSVSIQKPGFKAWEGPGYPATGAVVKAVLEPVEE